MSEVSMILPAAVPPGGIVDVPVPGLRHGDIESGTGTVTVGGFVQPAVTYAVDYAAELIQVRNDGENPWAQGAALVVTWEGTSLELMVKDHEERLDALEAGGGTGGGTDPALEARVAALETEVDNHKWQLVDHEARIANNRRDITALEARVAALEAAKA